MSSATGSFKAKFGHLVFTQNELANSNISAKGAGVGTLSTKSGSVDGNHNFNLLL